MFTCADRFIVFSCCPPSYPHGDEISYHDLLLTPEEEAEMIAANRPLNDYCVVGTHNSCHVCNLFGWLFIKPWHYTHPRLPCAIIRIAHEAELARIAG